MGTIQYHRGQKDPVHGEEFNRVDLGNLLVAEPMAFIDASLGELLPSPVDDPKTDPWIKSCQRIRDGECVHRNHQPGS